MNPAIPSIRDRMGRRLSALAFVAVAGFSLYLAVAGLRTRFAPDDMMNLHEYWARGFWNVLWHNVIFWSSAYRPAGGLYYLPLYHLFGLDPQPYRIVLLVFVVANAYLSCVTAELLTGSRVAAAITGLLAGAHASMPDIYFVNSQIYDVLACFFVQVTLIGYIGIRRRGSIPGRWQSIWLVGAFVTALNAKEISAPLAGFILAYELLFHGFPKREHFMEWLKREGRIPALFSAITAVYLAGKLLAHNPSLESPQYRLQITFAHYVQNNNRYLQQMLYAKWREPQWLFGIDAALLVLLIFARRIPALRWAAFYGLTATIPLSFIPAREGGSLYVPVFGWALMAGIAAATAARWFTFAFIPPLRTPVQILLIAFLIWRIVLFESAGWAKHARDYYGPPEKLTWGVIQQLRDSPYRPSPQSSVLILDDPFEEYDAQVIANLVWNDPTVTIKLGRRFGEPLAEEARNRFDDLVTLEGGNFRVIRSSSGR